MAINEQEKRQLRKGKGKTQDEPSLLTTTKSATPQERGPGSEDWVDVGLAESFSCACLDGERADEGMAWVTSHHV
jgi:hypothetical protein